jgi:hypothetical protein
MEVFVDNPTKIYVTRSELKAIQAAEDEGLATANVEYCLIDDSDEAPSVAKQKATKSQEVA